jgi:hypothetical protein
MLAILFSILLGIAQQPPVANSQSPESKPAAVVAKTLADPAEVELKILDVKRIYVESFGEDPVAKQVQAMLISSLAETKKYVVTENRDKADAILKGTAVEKTSQELHSYDDQTSAGVVHGSAIGNTAVIGGAGAAIKDASTSTETIHDARVAVRIVDNDGDVIWSSTQESKGAKYRGASADAADKVIKQLMRDLERIGKRRSATGHP